MEVWSAQQIWDATLGELQAQVSKANYRTWLARTTGLGFQDGQFVIGVPNTFVAEYLEKNQRSLIEKTLTNLTHHEVQVQFQVNNTPPGSPRHQGIGKKATPVQQTSFPLFNPKYTFDSFIVGSCNQLAYDAARGVAQEPGQRYNPLYIYSQAGLGKTHLLQAIGHTALARNLRVLYISAEQFTNEFVGAIREKKMGEFHAKYRSPDVLLIDDIQFLSGKEQTRENFFHTFDHLHNANRQIVISSDCPPRSLSLVPSRLRSRFEWGLVAGIQAPGLETRMAILQAKADEKGVDISADVLELIALQIQQNIRALEGSINRVVAYARLLKSLITPELALQALEDIASKGPQRAAVTPGQVIDKVADSFRLTPQELVGRKRDKATTLARQIAMYLLKQETDYSLTRIGQELGGRDHHTVSQAYQKITRELADNPDLRDRLSALQQRLHSLQDG